MVSCSFLAPGQKPIDMNFLIMWVWTKAQQTHHSRTFSSPCKKWLDPRNAVRSSTLNQASKLDILKKLKVEKTQNSRKKTQLLKQKTQGFGKF